MHTPAAFCQMLAIRYPIVQAPMLGVTTPEMVAAVSNAGGLGALPVGGLSPERTSDLIRKTKTLTTKQFAVNLFAHDLPASIDEPAAAAMQAFLENIYHEYHIPFKPIALAGPTGFHYRGQLATLLAENIRIVSFTFGILDSESTKQLKQHQCTLIGTATSVAEAIALEKEGADAVVAQGIEAGGHRGSFLPGTLPQIGLMALVPAIADAIKLPVIAAGGLFDARTIRAAFAIGASAAQLGSIFIPAHESAASEAYKLAVLQSDATDTVLTRAFSGRWARGVKNEFISRLEEDGPAIPEYTVHSKMTSPLRIHGQANNIKDLIALWAGQSATRGAKDSTTDIFNRLVTDLHLNQHA